jgi:hypothetical protein
MNPPPMPSNPAEDKGPMILAVMWTLTLFTTLFVVARWYVRLFLVKSLGLDDWLALVGTVSRPEEQTDTLCAYLYRTTVLGY